MTPPSAFRRCVAVSPPSGATPLLPGGRRPRRPRELGCEGEALLGCRAVSFYVRGAWSSTVVWANSLTVHTHWNPSMIGVHRSSKSALFSVSQRPISLPASGSVVSVRISLSASTPVGADLGDGRPSHSSVIVESRTGSAGQDLVTLRVARKRTLLTRLHFGSM